MWPEQIKLEDLDANEKNLVNKVLNALREVPVVRSSIDSVGPRKSLLLSERLIIAKALLPVLKELRDASPRPSQDV